MNVLDLFAGAGGLSEGFRQAGFNIIAHVEMDKSACNTLKTREAFYYLKDNKKLDYYIQYLKKEIKRDELYNKIPQMYLEKVIQAEISEDSIDDISHSISQKLSYLNNKQIDIIIGGPPCQAYSTAGRSRDPNRMKNDPRNYLYKHYITFLEKFRPKIFIFENVKGILTAKNGEVFQDLILNLKNANYNLEYKSLNAADFGVAQDRKRIILIGWQSKYSFSYPDFGNIPNNITIKELFKDLPKLKAGDSIDGEEKYISSSTPHPFIKKKNWKLLTQHITRPNNSNDLLIYKTIVYTWNTRKKILKYNELPKKYQTHKNTKSFLDRYKLVRYDSPSHTVVAHIAKDGHYYIHPDIEQNRSISVREAARIQSFPDDYYFEDSRTAAFKQIGNAVPPLMAFHIAKKIYYMLKTIERD